MKIEDFELGEENPVYLIAEMSANHNGSIENAKKTILAAKNSGADAIKIQTYTPDTLTIKSDRPEFILKGGLWDGRQLYDLYNDAHTPFEWHSDLFDYAKACGITLFSTPFDETAVDLLEELNSPAYKIASFELVHLPLIQKVARCKKPLLMSTGAASLDEITEAIKTARDAGAEEILLFHCISSYPAPVEDSKLRAIEMLKKKYGVLVGLSDHSVGSEVGFLSAALGISAIEKHFIINKAIGGPDSDFSATPIEFEELRKKIDLAKNMLGSNHFGRAKSEEQSSTLRRSIYFQTGKKKGQILSKNDIKIIRPGLGMHPRYFRFLEGKKLIEDVSYGEPVKETHFEDSFDFGHSINTDFILSKINPTKEQEISLYELLLKRRYNISHQEMPTFQNHADFVRNHPYRGWWLIYGTDMTPDQLLGSVYVNGDNSVGLDLDFSRIDFSANYLVTKLKKIIMPLKAEKSKRYKDFFFNVSPENHEFIDWLSESNFCVSQKSFTQS